MTKLVGFLVLGFGLILSSTFGSSAIAADTKSTVVLDVRTPEEFAGGHVDGALNIDVQSNDFAEKIAKLDKAKSYKLYCRSGKRSGKALEAMKAMGFKDVENVGGYEEAKVKLTPASKAK